MNAIKTMDNSGAKTINRSVSRLTPMEVEVIELFVQFSRALGQPRSVAEIYGLLFVSHLPLTLQDLKERLNISLGSDAVKIGEAGDDQLPEKLASGSQDKQVVI